MHDRRRVKSILASLIPGKRSERRELERDAQFASKEPDLTEKKAGRFMWTDIAVRNVVASLLALIAYCYAGSPAAQAAHWVANSDWTIPCDGPIPCAIEDLKRNYGPPNHLAGCETSERGAVCHNYYFVMWTYEGFSSEICDSNEQPIGTGCMPKDQKRDQTAGTCTRVDNPTDARTGQKYERVTDLSTSGPFPLQFERHYFSTPVYWSGPGTYAGRLGRNWRSTFDVSVTARYPYGNAPDPWWVEVIRPDGTASLWFPNGSGGYKRQGWNPQTQATEDIPGTRDVLSWTGTAWQYSDENDTLYVFNDQPFPGDSRYAPIKELHFRGGYTQSFAYDANGLNTSVSDNLGRSMTFTYGTNKFLSQVSLPDGTSVKYTYVSKTTYPGIDLTTVPHSEYALTSVLYPDSTSGTDTDNPKLTYFYESASDPYLLTGKQDERSIRTMTWSYAADGRVSQSQHNNALEKYTFVYDDANSKTTVTNPLSKQTIFNLTRATPVPILVTSVQGVASANCPAGLASYTYDANKFTASMTDEEGRVTAITNDARGLPTTVIRGSGTASAATATTTWHSTLHVPTQLVEPGVNTTFTWDANNRLTQVTKTDTLTTTVPYSTAGQTRTWVYAYGTGGVLASVDGPLAGTGDTVSYAYNASGFLQTITNEVGHVTTITAWNGRGQPTSITDPNGVVTTIAYDPRGWVTTITRDSAGTPSTTTIAYALNGSVSKVTQANGAYEQYTYDNDNRLSTITNNLSETVNYTRNAMGAVTSVSRKKAAGTVTYSRSQTLDELNRLLTSVGAASQTFSYGYDKTSNLKTVTDPRSNSYSYGFDALNRLISETDEGSNTVQVTRNGTDAVTAYKDPRLLTTSYVRNGFGDIIQEISPDRGTTVYQRDARGLITQRTDARSVVTNYSYDNAGRVTARSYPAATAENVTFTWDSVVSGNKGKGRLTGMTDQSGTTVWTYDVRGNVLSEKRTISSYNYTVAYTYDLADKLTRITYPSGRIVDYARDTLGRVSGVTTKPNAAGTSQTLAYNIAYQPYGALQSVWYGNGLDMWRTFTGDDLLDMLLVEDTSAGTALMRRYHTRTDGMNLTNIYDDLDSTKNQSFWYTAAGRLQNASGPWGALTYYYDGVGNRTYEITDVGSTHTEYVTGFPTTSNKPNGVTVAGSTVRSYGHDAAGNMTTDTKAGVTWTYTYNKAGRLSQAKSGTTLKGTYTYDGLERLGIRIVSNTTPSGTSHLIYDTAGRLLAETNGTGTTTREYVWMETDAGMTSEIAISAGDATTESIDGHRLGKAESDSDPFSPAQLPSIQLPKPFDQTKSAIPLSIVDGVNTGTPTIYYVHPDHLNRPVMMTNAAKTSVWNAVYKPFGETYALSGSLTLNLRFPGQWYQLETGLAYNWHRSYDPTMGRYTQPDPLGATDRASVYAYADSDPIERSDFSGLMGSRGAGRFSPMCGRCQLRYDSDNRKGPHTHWVCPGQREGCIKKDGTLCDGSAPPPENVKECLRDRGRVPQDYSRIGLFCAGVATLAICALKPEICVPSLIVGGVAAGASR